MKRLNLRHILLCISFLSYDALVSIPEIISPKQIALIQDQSLREKFIEANQQVDTVYIPNAVKQIVKNSAAQYPGLNQLIDLALFDSSSRFAPAAQVKDAIKTIIEYLTQQESSLAKTDDIPVKFLDWYLHKIESKKTRSELDELEKMESDSDADSRAINLFYGNTGTAIMSGGSLNIYGVSNIGTQAAGNTVNIGLNSPLNLTGSLNLSGVLNLTGSLNISGALNLNGQLTLSSFTGGVLTSSPTGVISSRGTTNNAVQIGNITGTLTSIPVGTNGQVLIGATNAQPLFSTLTSNAGTISFTPGPNSLNLEANVATKYPTDAGTASPSGNALDIRGGSNINTSTGANSETVTINLNSSPSVTGTITAGGNINAGGNISAGGNINATGTITAGSGLVVQSGGINATGPTILHSLSGSGVVTTSSTGLLSSSATTANAVQVGNNTGTLTSIPVGTNGQLLLGSTNRAPFFTGLSSPANPSGATSMIYASGANFLSLQSVPLLVNTLRVDWLNGSDTIATVTNGLPFKTITGAMNAISSSGIASSVNPVVVWIMPGIYNETVTMQSYVSLIGLSEGSGAQGSPNAGVIIQQLNVTSNTTLISMADNSRLQNVSLNLTCASATPTALAGIAFSSGTSSATARVQDVTLSMNVTNFSSSGTIYGINATSTGTPSQDLPAVTNSNIYVNISASSTSSTAAAVNVSPSSSSQGITLNNCNLTITSAATGFFPIGSVYLQQGTCYINEGTIVASKTGGDANQMTGISIVSGSAVSATCTINNCPITVSSNGANNMGIYTAGTITPTTTLNSSPITASNSSGGGTAYGIYWSTSAGSLTANNCAINASSPGSTYGAYINSGSATFNNCSLNGPTLGYDLFNNTGSVSAVKLYNTALVNFTTNANFTGSPISVIFWVGTGALSTTTTRYLLPGNTTANVVRGENATTQTPLLTGHIIKNLIVNAVTAPGSPNSTTFTLRKNGADTALTTTLTGTATSASDTTHVVSYAANDVLSMQITSTSTLTANFGITVELY